MKTLTDKIYANSFEEQKPYVFIFTKNNCPNCKIVEEYFKKIKKDKQKPCNFNIYIINGEENKILKEIFLTNNGIRAYPVTFFIKDNKAISIIGAKKIGEFILNIKNLCKGQEKTLRLKIQEFKNFIFGDED